MKIEVCLFIGLVSFCLLNSYVKIKAEAVEQVLWCQAASRAGTRPSSRPESETDLSRGGSNK